jgi:PAS domain S-box-containing protein
MSFSSIKNFWNGLLNVPSTDPDDARRRKLLNILLLGTIIMGALVLITITLFLFSNANQLTPSQSGDIFSLVYVNIAALMGSILFYLINRFISGWLASSLFLIFLLVILSLSDSPVELTDGRSLFVYTIPIVMASVLLQSWASFIFAGLGSLTIIIVAYFSGIHANEIAMIGYFFLAFISWLSSRNLEQTLKELRSINTDLDKVVAERTSALAEVLTRERIEAGRNETILNSIADGVMVLDSQNITMLINPALSQLTEMPIEKLTGITLNEFIQAKEFSIASRGIIAGIIEHPEEAKSGIRLEWGKKTLSVSIARVQDTRANQNIGAVAVFRDITRETEIEKMKETFVAVVSHELRTPLNAIMGYTEMIKESVLGPINEKQSEALERIMVNLKRLFLMVGDLLDEAQIKAGKLSIKKQEFKTASLLENLHAAMYKIAIDQGLYLTSKIDSNMPETIIGDQQRQQQILLNLVNNSIKFTKTGGVDVNISRADENHWEIEVTDTGAGIPESEISHIFESFRQIENTTTRRHQGFGLGLSIVKQLVELQDGKISVKSELDKGSVFTVSLPLLPL